jgi:hypothetical protein
VSEEVERAFQKYERGIEQAIRLGYLTVTPTTPRKSEGPCVCPNCGFGHKPDTDNAAVKALGDLISWIDSFIGNGFRSLGVNDLVTFEERMALAKARGDKAFVYNHETVEVPL